MRTLPQTHKHIATAILAVIAACGWMAAMSETVTLTGSNEVPPATTSATGTANITVGADRSVIVIQAPLASAFPDQDFRPAKE